MIKRRKPLQVGGSYVQTMNKPHYWKEIKFQFWSGQLLQFIPNAQHSKEAFTENSFGEPQKRISLTIGAFIPRRKFSKSYGTHGNVSLKPEPLQKILPGGTAGWAGVLIQWWNSGWWCPYAVHTGRWRNRWLIVAWLLSCPLIFFPEDKVCWCIT